MSVKYLTLVLLLSLISLSNAEAADPIGIASNVIKNVNITRAGEQKMLNITKGTEIFVGDTIHTKDDESYVRIVFIDKTYITMNGKDGELTIDKYIFDPKNSKDDGAQFKILRASFEFVGGLLDKSENDNVRIDLDLGSIGVRGTKILRSMRNNECWIYLEEGNIRVFNDGGSVNLSAGEGTTLTSKTNAPRDVEKWNKKDIDWITNTTRMHK